MTKPVVVGITGDKQTNVLTYAVEEARRTGSVLRIVHSIAASPQVADYYAGYELLDTLRVEGQVVLDEARAFVEDNSTDVPAEYILDNKPPAVALKTLSTDARLLIVGSDDVPWFDRLVRGRVAGHVALHADCPVAVVPTTSVSAFHEGSIILTLDGETSADGPIRFAFEQAAQQETALVVLHVALPGTLAKDNQSAAANISEVMAGWSADYPDTTVIKTFIDGDPLETVRHATETAGLVVVGRPHTNLALVGVTHPLATLVLRHTHSPLAIVPASYRGA
jgi:nucleotide-binding universal stress UspA family protein